MTQIIRLIREQPLQKDCTLGILEVNDKFICHTLELPWLNNSKSISCIPVGIYKVTKYISPTKGLVFLLHDVPNRSMIEIHKGNTIKDIKGCILVGLDSGILKGERAVLKSAKAMQMLLSILPAEFTIEVL